MVILTHGLLMFALAVTAGPPYVVDYRLEADAGLMDRTVYYSAPDSLHLDACGGNGYRCLPVRRVKPGARYRLSFHYLVAAGSEGILSARVLDYEGHRLEWGLTAVGRWKFAEVNVDLGHEVTSACVVFECEATAGVFEAWIDDVVFRPVGVAITTGP